MWSKDMFKRSDSPECQNVKRVILDLYQVSVLNEEIDEYSISQDKKIGEGGGINSLLQGLKLLVKSMRHSSICPSHTSPASAPPPSSHYSLKQHTLTKAPYTVHPIGDYLQSDTW